MKVSFRWIALVILDVKTVHVIGYVTSGLPGHTHRAWLKQESFDLCEQPTGDLTKEMCTKAPQLLSAWAQNPYIPHTEQQYMHTQDVFPHHGKECAIECERILKRLVDERTAGNTNAIATTAVYNSLIDIWSRSGDAAGAQRAEEILVSMQDAYIAGDMEVQPNLESFKMIINAWSKASKDERDAPFRAQAVLDWMIQLYENRTNDLAQPDQECFDILLHTWAMSGAPEEAENLMRLLDVSYREGNINIRPTCLSFNHLLTAWANSEEPEGAQRAEDLLHHMRHLSVIDGNEDMKPNRDSYMTVISAWTRRGTLESAKSADSILKLAINEVGKNRDEYIDAIMFNLVSDAYAKTSYRKAHLKSRAVLDQQRALYENGHDRCKPDVYSFSSVLGSCASLGGSKIERRSAFEVARRTFEDMCTLGVIPNHVTYGTMLKACARLLPTGKERVKYVREYFKMACKSGCVGNMVMRRFEEAASSDQYRGLMKGVTRDSLPAEWIASVPKYDKSQGRGERKNNRLTP